MARARWLGRWQLWGDDMEVTQGSGQQDQQSFRHRRQHGVPLMLCCALLLCAQQVCQGLLDLKRWHPLQAGGVHALLSHWKGLSRRFKTQALDRMGVLHVTGGSLQDLALERPAHQAWPAGAAGWKEQRGYGFK